MRQKPRLLVGLILLLALLYIISPIDLIPDFIPVVGWVDDVVVDAGAWILSPASNLHTRDAGRHIPGHHPNPP